MERLFSASGVDKLLLWFEEEGLAYPWGKNPEPYRVWISEVMLQQTVVTGVVPYFEKWMARFPGVPELAAAEEGEVLRLWEGLGYYSRARNLLAAARIIRDEYAGKLPENQENLKSLPGIGDYTSRAILSIAFGRPLAVMDANVKRIARRAAGLEVFGPPEERELLAALEASLPAGRAGDFNAALMQLGQLVCRLKNPGCLFCPFFGECRAAAEGTVDKIPGSAKKAITEISSDVFIYVRDNKIFLYRKPAGLGQGLYTLPRKQRPRQGGEAGAGPAEFSPFSPEIPGEKGKWAGETASFGGVLRSRTHNYTRFRETLLPRIIFVDKNAAGLLAGVGPEEEENGAWFEREELPSLAVFSVYRQILEEAEKILFSQGR